MGMHLAACTFDAILRQVRAQGQAPLALPLAVERPARRLRPLRSAKPSEGLGRVGEIVLQRKCSVSAGLLRTHVRL